ncbi:hypothetical protein [Janibacter hoylei]|uniref:hypothetical protein n=1 Tax=Janibacter hoylei TaxID=364298 RepID=UPI0021A38339|nr:hypothetical protein [Janibacter hoylei]MCT2293050.1 hypothetical protein [Janibacter hoylei]
MQIETMVFLGWASVPVLAYGVSAAALRHSRRHATQQPRTTDPSARLEELRRRPVEGSVSRGRMAEAIRLADDPVAASLTHRRG